MFVWLFEDYFIYASVILGLSLISILSSFWDIKKNYKKIQQIAAYESNINIKRQYFHHYDDNNIKTEGNIRKQMKTLKSYQIVPGDIIEIPEGQKMPCDILLLNGIIHNIQCNNTLSLGLCIMNESMLTGESIPVIKNFLPYSDNIYNVEDTKSFTLYAGTTCLETRFYQKDKFPVLGLVISTGFNTVKGQLIRSIMFPKPISFKFYRDSMKFIAAMSLIALICNDIPIMIL